MKALLFNRIRTLPVLACLCLSLLPVARAQTGVVAASGVPVPGAIIRATQGGTTLTAATDDEGRYRLDGLTNGTWVMEVEMFRFETARQGVRFEGASHLAWNLKLKPLSAAAPASAPAIQIAQNGPRTSPGPGQQRRQHQMRQQNGHRGAAIPELSNQIAGGTNAGNALESIEVPANVQGDSANEAFLLRGTLSRGLKQMGGDPGGDMGPGFGRGPGMFGGGEFGGPGVRSDGQNGFAALGRGITEIVGNRANPAGQGLHALINVVLHSSALEARPFAVNGQEIAKPSYSKERFSIQIGGPLIIPKLFRLENTAFAFDYTVNRSENLSSQIGTVPTLLERSGDFSLSNRLIYNPTTHTPYPGNVIPLAHISPIALALLNFFPLPNQRGSCPARRFGACTAQNYQFTTTAPNNNQSIGVRLGQRIGRRDRLSLNFQEQGRSATMPQIFGFLDHSDSRGFSTSLNWTHNFAPRMFNMASISFNRNTSNLVPYFANTMNVAAALGIEGTSTNPLNYGPPNLSFTNFAGLTDGSPSYNVVQSVNVNEAFTWMRGTHSLSFGGLFGRSQNNICSDANGRGAFAFTGLSTSELDANGRPLSNTGYDFADFLLGLPNSSSIRYGDTNTYFRGGNYAFFGQDEWRMRPNLAIDFGLRYEYFGVPYELHGQEANLDIAPHFRSVTRVIPGAIGPYTGKYPAGLVNPDRDNFAPRFAVAWRPRRDGKTMIRAGYGWYYNGAVYNGFMRNLSAQPPFADTNSVITSSEALLTLAQGFLVTPRGKTVTNTWAIDRFYRAPYAQSWNLTIQQDLPGRLVLQLGYLGTKGTRLDTQRLPNRAAPGSPLTAEERRAIDYATGFTFETSDANSIYHAARLTLLRRFSRGMSFNIDYLFAKSIDDASTFGGGLAQNDQDIRAERSLSKFDHRHTLNATYVLTSPFGHNSRMLLHHDLINRFLEDWTLTGGITAQTGAPLNPRVGGNLSDSAGTGATGTTRPDATGLSIDAGGSYFNAAAFALPLPGNFGSAGRNTIPGLSSVVLNASFGRGFGLGERRNLEFRLEANNLLNHVNISGIGTTLNSTTYGLPLSAGAMRSIAITLRFRF